MWPDIEVELVARLAARLGIRFVTELPANLDQVLPVGQVQRVGGSDDTFRLDRALVDVDVYAATRRDASTHARRVREELVLLLPGAQTTAAVFGQVRTVSAPSWRPYENTALRRLGATYSLMFHPVS